MDEFPYIILFTILPWLILPIIIIWAIVHFIAKVLGKKHGEKPAIINNSKWYLQLSTCKEDAASQMFLLLSLVFVWLTMLSFNHNLQDPFSWKSMLLVSLVIGGFVSYWLKAIYPLSITLLGFIIWWGAKANDWMQTDKSQGLSILFGITLFAGLYYLLGRGHERNKKYLRFSMVYLLLGIVILTGFLFFLSTRLGMQLLQDSASEGTSATSLPLLASFVFLGVLGFATAVYNLKFKLVSIAEIAMLAAILALFLIVELTAPKELFVDIPKIGYGEMTLSSSGMLWALVFNLAIFFEVLGLILLGYRKQEEWLVNLGAVLMFLLIIVKYFDWFFSFLDKSVFFIGAGILLFGVGWFMEKGRRYMLASIKAQNTDINNNVNF